VTIDNILIESNLKLKENRDMSNTNIADIEIDEEIRKSARKCEINLACLSERDHKLCPITSTAGKKMLCLDCTSGRRCNYRVNYGVSAFLCTCPIRKEIYRKYKK
jgi:hypothetical protein